MYMLYDCLRLTWVISFLDRRLCCAPCTAFFCGSEEASQTPAGRSSSRSNQAGPPAAQTGLYPVPDCLLEYFLSIFHFIPPPFSPVLFHLAFLCWFGFFHSFTWSLPTPPCSWEKELMFVRVSSCIFIFSLYRTSSGQEYVTTLCA